MVWIRNFRSRNKCMSQRRVFVEPTCCLSVCLCMTVCSSSWNTKCISVNSCRWDQCSVLFRAENHHRLKLSSSSATPLLSYHVFNSLCLNSSSPPSLRCSQQSALWTFWWRLNAVKIIWECRCGQTNTAHLQPTRLPSAGRDCLCPFLHRLD